LARKTPFLGNVLKRKSWGKFGRKMGKLLFFYLFFN